MTSGNMKTVPDNSKFFEYLNKRLTQNEDVYLSARQLFHNFCVAVVNNTNTVPQYGVIQETGDEGGEFIFIRKEALKKLRDSKTLLREPMDSNAR